MSEEKKKSLLNQFLFDPAERLHIGRNFREKTFPRLIGTRWLMTGTLSCYALYFFVIARHNDNMKYKFSISRKISQLTGILTSITLPPYFRAAVYSAFGSIYGVNFDEIKQENLNNFRSFNSFFTRELKESARPIADQYNDHSLTSPCDGTVLSFGEVNTLTSTIECVKGNDYKLSEFLFGSQPKTSSVD